MGNYFGTDGFSGEAEITLTADHAYNVGRFLDWYYNACVNATATTTLPVSSLAKTLATAFICFSTV